MRVHPSQREAWYRTLDQLYKAKERIEEVLYRRLRDLFIPYAAMSATSSNCWKLSVINEASASAYLVVRPSRTSWMAA